MIVNEQATEQQRNALIAIESAQLGGLIWEIPLLSPLIRSSRSSLRLHSMSIVSGGERPFGFPGVGRPT